MDGVDDDCVVVVAGCDVEGSVEFAVGVWGVEEVVSVEVAEEVWVEVERFAVVEEEVDVVDVVLVEAVTENCAWAWAFEYFGGSVAVTYTVY